MNPPERPLSRSNRQRSRSIRPGALTLLALLLLSALAVACQERTIRQNYSGFKSDEEIGILVQRGYRFRLDGDLNEPVDRLNLAPGKYVIEFIDTFTGIKGAALCEIQKGTRYEIYPGGYRDFPRAMKRVMIGTCAPQPAETGK